MRGAETRAGRRWIAGAVIAVLSAVALSAQRVESTWPSGTIVVDGLTADWPSLRPITSNGPAMAAVNDGEYLYLAVTAAEERLLPPVALGLIVWIDPARRRAETFGLRVPGVLQPLLPGMDPDANPQTPDAFSTRTFDRFDLLGPGKNQRRLVDLVPDMGIEMAAGFSENEITYEVKIPLVRSGTRPYAVGAGPGATISLGIATPESPRHNRPQRLVGSDGFIGGHPFFGGGFASFREPDGRVEPIKYWTALTLAAAK